MIVAIVTGDGKQIVDTAGNVEISFVDVDPSIGKRDVAGDVILVPMAVNHCVDRQAGTSLLSHGDGRVDDHRLTRTLHQQAITRGVRAVAPGGQDSDVVSQLAGDLTPGIRHGRAG